MPDAKETSDLLAELVQTLMMIDDLPASKRLEFKAKALRWGSAILLDLAKLYTPPRKSRPRAKKPPGWYKEMMEVR